MIEVFKQALEALKDVGVLTDREWRAVHKNKANELRQAIAKLESQEPVKIAHRHEWFRTGEMKVGQMRCINCGAWGQEEITQRTWVGLTNNELQPIADEYRILFGSWVEDFARAIETKLKEKNCAG